MITIITKIHSSFLSNQLQTLEGTAAMNSQAWKHDTLNLSTFGKNKVFLHFLNNTSLFPENLGGQSYLNGIQQCYIPVILITVFKPIGFMKEDREVYCPIIQSIPWGISHIYNLNIKYCWLFFILILFQCRGFPITPDMLKALAKIAFYLTSIVIGNSHSLNIALHWFLLLQR